MARSATIDSIITTTLPKVRTKIQQFVYRKNALTSLLMEKAKIVERGGESIYEPVFATAPVGATSYSGADTFSTTITDTMTSSQWSWKIIGGTAGITGEDEMKNSGPEAKIDLAEARIDQMKMAVANYLDNNLHGDGTGNSSKDFNGLKLLVSTGTPITNPGGLSETTYANWANQRATGITYGNSQQTTTGGYYTVRSVFLDCTDGTESPDCGIACLDMYESLLNTIGVNERYQMDSEHTKAFTGFQTINAWGTPVVMTRNSNAGSYANDDAKHYWLNTDYLKLVIHKDKNFVMEGPQKPYDQDVKWWKLMVGGELICTNRRMQGVVEGIAV